MLLNYVLRYRYRHRWIQIQRQMQYARTHTHTYIYVHLQIDRVKDHCLRTLKIWVQSLLWNILVNSELPHQQNGDHNLCCDN